MKQTDSLFLSCFRVESAALIFYSIPFSPSPSPPLAPAGWDLEGNLLLLVTTETDGKIGAGDGRWDFRSPDSRNPATPSPPVPLKLALWPERVLPFIHLFSNRAVIFSTRRHPWEEGSGVGPLFWTSGEYCYILLVSPTDKFLLSEACSTTARNNIP